jgi:hypothetical protein
MPYTLWSRDRLLGESALDYRSNTEVHRMGDFFPTVFGESLMPVITGVSRALFELRKSRIERERASGKGPGALPRIDVTTEYADVAEATNRFEELELQLRGPDGAVIETEGIHINDHELAMEWCELPIGGVDEYDELMFDTEVDEELQAMIDHDAALIDEWFSSDGDEPGESWDEEFESIEERPLPRYQIQVLLPGFSESEPA